MPSAAQNPGAPIAEAQRAAEPTVTTAPLPGTADPQYPDVQLHDVACTSTGQCFAVGSFNRPGSDRRALVETLRDGQWTASELPLPRDAKNDPGATLTAVSCSGASMCVAIGSYRGGGALQPLLATWNGSSWSASSPRLPADAAKPTIAPLTAVSCGGTQSCVAVGAYPTDKGRARPLMVALRAGRWTSVAGRLPRGAASGELWAVDCTGSRACVAVGAWEPQVADGAATPQFPLAQVLAGKRWRAGTPPIPKNGKGRFVAAILTSVSCAAKSRCTALGSYHRGGPHGPSQPVLIGVLGRSGWKAGSVAPPPGLPRNHVTMDEVSCPAVRSCVGAGTHAGDRGRARPAVARISDRDGSALEVPPATDGSRPVGYVADVACGAPSACIGVGRGEGPDHGGQALIVSVRGSEVSSSAVALPPDASGGSLSAVAMQSPTHAVAVGFAGARGLLVTDIAVG